jgi:acetyl esterase
MPHAYDPELAPIVGVLPQLDISDVPAARAQMRAMREQVPPFVQPDGITIHKRAVPGPPGDPDIEVAIFRPGQPAANSPALYWIHGGGFVLGDVDGDMAVPAQFAAELGAIVVSVEYRLAPEHPFPAPVEDCYAGLAWMSEHAGEIGFDPGKLAIGGPARAAGWPPLSR